MNPVPKLSELAGVDEELFKGTKPSKELEATRKQRDLEFRKRVRALVERNLRAQNYFSRVRLNFLPNN